MLWNGGISFGGVIAFIFADLPRFCGSFLNGFDEFARTAFGI